MKLVEVFSTPKNKSFFFGYHDTSQISHDDKYILSIKVDDIYSLPTSAIGYDIYLFDINTGFFDKVSSTKTVNFQQGSRLHWIDNNHFITNDFNGFSYFSKIIDIKTKNVVKKFNHPIYSLSNNKKFALNVDFERLYWKRRGYSYDAIQNKNKNYNLYPNESINFFSLDGSIDKKLFTINDVLKINFNNMMLNSTHYLEHISISPDDKKFIFLHRYKLDDGGIFTRLMKYNFSDEKLSLLVDSGRISHFTWISNSELLFYGSFGNILTLARKKTYFKKLFKILLKFYKSLIKDNSKISKLSTGDGYKIINVDNMLKKNIKNNLLNKEDGHPSSYGNNNFFTDTYPDNDNFNKATLYNYDISSDTLTILEKLNSIKDLDNTPLRCDLHPRVSTSKKYLSIDSMRDGKRSSIVYKIER